MERGERGPNAMTGDTKERVDTETALRRHAHALCVDIGPRTLEGGGLTRAEAYIAGELAAMGHRVERQAYTARETQVANLVCRTGPPDSAVGGHYLVGAHYDTVPGTPGADDNASAVCVLLELARRLAERPPEVPLRLVAFTLEEPPAFMTRTQGSRVYTRRVREAGERVHGAAILEMVGYTSARQSYPAVLRWAGYPAAGDFIGIVGNLRSRGFGRRLLRGFRRNKALPAESIFVPFNGWILPPVRASDHASFWDRGWPGVMITDTAYFRNPHYHTPGDRIETLDFTFMARLVESLELGLSELAELAKGP